MKNVWIYSLAVLSLTACTNEVEENFTSDERVKVELNTSVNTPDLETLGTRAPIDGTSLPSGLQVTVFGLAKSSNTSSVTDIDWSQTSNVLFGSKSAPSGMVEARVQEDGSLSLGSDYYYPVESTRNYSFYACYPGGKFSPDDTKTSYVAKFNLADQNDIMWAEAIAPAIGNYNGYNARYFRKASGAKRPQLQFNHLLTRLNFKVTRGDVNNGPSEDVSDVYVKSVAIVKQDPTLKLTLSKNYVTSETSGKMSLEAEKGGQQPDLTVKATAEDYDQELGLLAQSKVALDYGNVMLLPGNSYSLKVTLCRAKGEEWTNNPDNEESSIVLTLDDGEAAVPFLAGKAYEVVLTVYGWQKVGFETPTVVDWDMSDDEVYGGEIDF